MNRCEGCHRKVHPASLVLVPVLVCRQTYSSPAEYDEKRLCDLCREGGDEGPYERANQVYRDRTGSEL